jgi:hypothetical protein
MARIWSAITLKDISREYNTPLISSIVFIIGKNKSVSKLLSTSWKIVAQRSRPAPVSIFLFGSSAYSSLF